MPTQDTARDADPDDTTSDTGRDVHDHDRAVRATDGDDPVVTRSEERLSVGTRRQPVGRARLRRFVTTETRTVTVPVRREYAVLEVVPFDDTSYATLVDRADDPDGEGVVLVAEELVEVVTTRRPVARVRIGIEVRTADRLVTEAVRRERVVLEDDLREQRS